MQRAMHTRANLERAKPNANRLDFTLLRIRLDGLRQLFSTIENGKRTASVAKILEVLPHLHLKISQAQIEQVFVDFGSKSEDDAPIDMETDLTFSDFIRFIHIADTIVSTK